MKKDEKGSEMEEREERGKGTDQETEVVKGKG